MAQVLARWRKLQLETEHREILRQAAVPTEPQAQEIARQWQPSLPGDRAKLRGIPALTRGGLPSAIRGTQP